MSQVQVYGLPQSNFVWAVRIALAEKGVRHENVPVMSHTPEVVALHPLGKIPVLRHGDVTIPESRAIIDYVDHTFGGPSLVPADQSGGVARCDLDLDRRDVDGTVVHPPISVRLYGPRHG